MPRIAADNDHYTWVLRDDNTGRVIDDPDTEIKMISATTVINKTLAKPQLVPWAYSITLDNITGAVSELMKRGNPATDAEILDLLSDSADLREFMQQNRLRPEDVRDTAADRGHAGHAVLEKLAGANLELGHEGSDALAQRIKDSAANGWEEGIADWWQQYTPDVVASEKKLRSLQHGYAGTCDLIWTEHGSGALHITDLKTRGKGKGIYQSDFIQVAAYDIAYAEMYGVRADVTDVLVVQEDGKVLFARNNFDAASVFLSLLTIYKSLKEVK